MRLRRTIMGDQPKLTADTFTISWSVATLPDGQYVAVANLGGFTLRSSVCKTQLEATRNLFQLIGGAYNNPDADLGLSLAVSGTTLQDLGATAAANSHPQVTDGKRR